MDNKAHPRPLDAGYRQHNQPFRNRRFKTLLLTSATLLKHLNIDAEEIRAKKSRQLKNKLQFEKHEGPGLKSLSTGDAVFIYTKE